jgi:hypothetical protein
MKLFSSALAILSALAVSEVARAANSFAGSNLYYAAGLSSSQRATLFRYDNGSLPVPHWLHVLIYVLIVV